ncbi:ABC transporter permease [Planosporangium thailandense]|uniref:ABC transporter permease n=1 Tax=Planosporangium thailandense TaxID=765197 RepID=A0ABX0Y663_9ACTN|nr:ABC transporter permease [Planosporangium thailandense]NJC72923.1 ABC transporter permease [Planosporangium thailandense]
MGSYVIRRLLQFVPVILLASVAVWALIYAVPGNPADALVGPDATPQAVAAAKVRLGLDRPVVEQYFIWLGHALHLDLGHSAISGQPVTELMASRIPASIQLAVFSMVIGLVLAFPLGIASALKPRSVLTKAINLYQAVALAVPTFWVGILLIIGLAIRVHLFPSISNYVPFWADPVGAFKNTFMPALCLGTFISGIIARFVTASLRQSMSQDYIRTARAKGVPEYGVISRHALRNALLPTVTIVGLQVGSFLGGTVVTEVVFSYPGLGRMIYSAVTSRDYPVIQGAVLFIVVAFLAINLVVDVLYAYLDPRVQLR